MSATELESLNVRSLLRGLHRISIRCCLFLVGVPRHGAENHHYLVSECGYFVLLFFVLNARMHYVVSLYLGFKAIRGLGQRLSTCTPSRLFLEKSFWKWLIDSKLCPTLRLEVHTDALRRAQTRSGTIRQTRTRTRSDTHRHRHRHWRCALLVLLSSSAFPDFTAHFASVGMPSEWQTMLRRPRTQRRPRQKRMALRCLLGKALHFTARWCLAQEGHERDAASFTQWAP